jgi:two-component system phosphate regulon sensor histidine kinase PhoR
MGWSRHLRAIAAIAAGTLGLAVALAAGAPLPAAAAALMGGILAATAWLAGAGGDSAALDIAVAEPAAAAFLPAISDLIDALPEPVLLVRERRVIAANETALEVLGGHIVGSDVRLALRHPSAAERLTAAEAERSEVEISDLGGQDRRWTMTIDPLADGSRLVRLTDTSAAAASERMRSDFVANASHELRTPLATLVGYSETLLDEKAAPEGETRKKFLAIMHDEARRMQRIVEDLISLSRIEGERFSVPSEPVPLLPLVEEVRDACGRALADRKTRLTIDSSIEHPAVPGDRSQLLQLVQNLIENAVKYGRPGSEIRVKIEPRGAGMLRLSVADQGEGIAPEHLPRLTERFYRVDTGRSRSMGGTGLGLAIVKHVVGRHRGRLDIRSRLGEGTEVIVDLPSLSSKSHGTITEDTSGPGRGAPIGH